MPHGNDLLKHGKCAFVPVLVSCVRQSQRPFAQVSRVNDCFMPIEAICDLSVRWSIHEDFSECAYRNLNIAYQISRLVLLKVLFLTRLLFWTKLHSRRFRSARLLVISSITVFSSMCINLVWLSVGVTPPFSDIFQTHHSLLRLYFSPFAEKS